MKNESTLSQLFNCFAIAIMLFASFDIDAQTTNNQTVVQKCYTGPTVSNGNTFQNLMPGVNFVSGVDIPPGHKLVDVFVEVVWSKTDDGSCTPITGDPPQLQEVGFVIKDPLNPVRYLAASNLVGPLLATSTVGTFFDTTNTNVVNDTTVFHDGAFSGFPMVPVAPARDTIAPNNENLSFYCGQDPYGVWQLGLVDDAPGTGPQLCIHSYCITLVTCDFDTLVANCQAFPTVALDSTSGSHSFVFDDLDSLSDVSCLTKSITFSPSSVNCSDIGTPVSVTMTLQDKLDSTETCVSSVNVIDNAPPVIPDCSLFPSVWNIIYLDSFGVDTVFASEFPMTDNCGPITKEVRSFASPTYSDHIDFNCVVGSQQFFLRGTDGFGNITECLVRVDIRDTMPPEAICGQDTAYVGNGPVVMPASNLDNGSRDTCPPILGFWIDVHLSANPVYSCADLGSDTVTLIVSDASGNLGSCDDAVVIILDTVAPTAVCQNVNVILDASGNATLLATDVDNGSVDSCSIDSLDIDGLASIAYDCSHLNAPQAVTLNVFDVSDNTASCPATVTVLDNSPPTAICRNFTVHLDASGCATLVADSLNNNSIDVCTGNFLSFEIGGSQNAQFCCAELGSNAVTLTVLDSFGNSSTCPATVTVLDTISPVANCSSPTAYLNAAGSVTVFATDLSAGSTDNCAVVDSSVNVLGINSVAFNCTAIFTPQPVTLIVEDASGATGSCLTTVNVVDTVTPTAVCNATFNAFLDATGNVTVSPLDLDNGSNDNCGIVEYTINGFSTQTYSCTDIGTINAILTVRDSSGQSASCSASVTVIDNIPPTASCQVTNVYLDAAGTVAIIPADVLAFPATSDNCTSITNTFQGGLSNIVFDCDSVGPRIVNVVVTDGSTNTASCQTTVTVLDTVAPNASCSPVPYTVQLDAAGNGFVVPADVDNGSSDVCGIETMLVNGVDTFFYSCVDVGNTAVTLSVLDSSGILGTCVANIVVNDPISPTALCHDTTVYLDAAGVVTVFASEIDNGSFDNCSGLTLAINGLPSFNYDCNNVGINTATLSVTDGGGNTDLCPSNVTVLDTFTPVANCIAAATLNVFLDNTCFASVPASTFNNGSSDNCGSSLTFTVGGLPNATFTSANLLSNPNSVTLTVCDGSSNCQSCITSVIVRDTTSPVMVCKPDTVQLDALGNATVLPTNINDGSNDNCSSPSLTVNGALSVSMTCANIGSNNVTLIGTDPSGNVDSCIATVVVEDVTAPNASCNASVTVILDAFSSGTLTSAEVDLGSSDNCSITSMVLSQTSFNCGNIPGNPHIITMVVTDQSNNVDSCTVQVTVQDTVDPVANCIIAPLNLFLVGSTVSTTAAAIDNGSTDNCAIQSLTLSQSTFNCSDIGPNLVTLTVTDSSGEVGTCAATINVADNTDPVAFCSSPTVSLDASGTVQVAATDLALPGSFDNCSLSTILANGVDTVTFTCADLGSNLVTVFIQDPSSNNNTCPSTVTVVDGVDPVANCVAAPVELQLDVNGIAVLTVADVDAGSTDNCGIVSSSISQDTFRCIDIATNPNNVTFTVTDVSANTHNCVAQVTVNDTIRPTMACKPSTVNIHLSSGGLATITADSFDNGTFDACGIANLVFAGAPNPVSCADLGISPITLIATDVNGNIDSCNTTLTVLDTVSPTLTCNNITVDLDASGNVLVDASTPGLFSMSDACGTPTLTLNGGASVALSCTDLGANNITLVATDGSSNSAICISVVTIQDVTAPVVTCGSTTQFLDPSGQLAIDPSWITVSIVEACGVDSVFTTPDTLTCANVSPFNNVVLTVVDSSGNFSTCTANIEVQDTIPPTILCNDTTVCLSGGFVSVSATDIDGGTIDACGLSPVMSINGSNNVIYTCADIGPQIATLQRQDIHGNISSCTATVTIEDCTSPIANCQPFNYTVAVSPTGFVTVQAIEIDFSSSDDCGIDSSGFKIDGLDSLIYSCANVGIPDTVTMTVADVFGNTSTCVSVVEVVDNENPVARCGGPINVVLDAAGMATVSAFNLNATLPSTPSSDNCAIASFLINGQAIDTFDCSMLNNNTAVLTVTDLSGNTDTCNAIVNVLDNTPPTASCQATTTNLALDSIGQVSILASSLVTSSSDNCGIESILSNGFDTINFTCAEIGNNVIVVSVLDSSGNTFVCNSIVVVADNLPPVPVCNLSSVPAYLNASGFAYVTAAAIDSLSSDNCGINSYLINGIDSVLYNCNQIGTFPTATLTVTDANGNSNTCDVTVEVLDSISPVANCSSFTVTLGLNGIATVAPTAIDNGSFDNCGIASYLINGNSVETFNCTNVNTVNLVVLTVTDNNGNASFCTDTVTVEDVTSPQVQCIGAPVVYNLNASGTVTVNPQDLIVFASDSCSIVNYYIDGLVDSTFDCSHINVTHLVEVRVEDPSFNSATCNALVSIVDNTPPDVSNACQSNMTIALDSSGVQVVTGADISFFPTDNCSIVDTLINGQNSITFTCADALLPQPITTVLTLTDPSGNSDTCHTLVNLVDNINPVIVCHDTISVNLDAQGQVVVQAITLDDGSFDACSPLVYEINNNPTDTFNCTNIGSFPPAILTVSDNNGNSSTCISFIDVFDNTPPTAICQNLNVYIVGSSATLNASEVDNGSSDNCFLQNPVFSGGASSMSFSCADTGEHIVTVIVTDLYGNLDSCSATVTVRDTTPPAINCNQVTVDLTSIGIVGLVTGPFPGPLNVGNATDNCSLDTLFVSPDTITCTDIGDVPFVLTARDASGNESFCYDTARVLLDRPTITLPTQDTVLCEGDDLPLAATVPSNGWDYDFQWSGPVGQITFGTTTTDSVVNNVSIADEGFYIFSITRTTGVGCPALDSVFLDVNEVQPPVLSGLQPCDGDSTVINLNNTATYIGTTITYNWYFNGVPLSPSNNIDSLIIPDMTAADSGTYSMAITVSQGPATCSDSSVTGFTIDILDLPPAPLPTSNVPCEGDTLNLFNNAPGNTYNWDGPVSFLSTDSDPFVANASQSIAGTYNLTVTDANNCSNTGLVNVTVRPTPSQPDLSYNIPLCFGDPLILQDTADYDSTITVTYNWINSSIGLDSVTSINQLVLFDSSAPEGVYQLFVVWDGCVSNTAGTDSVVYELFPTANPDSFSMAFRDSLIGADIVLVNDVYNFTNGYDVVVIDSTDGGTIQVNDDGTISYRPRSGFFGLDTLVYAICDGFCPNSCDTAFVAFEVITDFECYVPNGISPNGDGINDIMIVTCKNVYPNAQMQVFSRWGTLVYDGPPTGWDGTFNGSDLPDGTYFYFLKLNDETNTPGTEPGRNGDEYSGFIMLQR